MDFDKIAPSFGNWAELFRPYIESKAFSDTFTNIKMQVQAGRVIIPKSQDVFKSFQLVDRHKIKVLIFLLDPYPSFSRDNVMIADGCPLSCKNTGVLQPSLQQFYNAIEKDYLGGFDPEFDLRPDNSYLLTEEHIMLINPSLTVEKDRVGSHQALWANFMKFFIEEILNKYYKGLPIILCGLQAHKLEKHFAPLLHYIKKIEHPAGASYQNRLWENFNCFKWADELIRQNNGESEVPRWYRLKSDTVVDESLETQDAGRGDGPDCEDLPF